MNDVPLRPEMKSKKWSEGYLYILDYGDGEQYKIGITTGDPIKRLNQITSKSGMLLPNPIEAKLVISLYMDTNPYYLEQLLHMQLVDNHVAGEWFKLAFRDLIYIVSQIQPFGVIDYSDIWYEKCSTIKDEINMGYLPNNISYESHEDIEEVFTNWTTNRF